ncbi:hypothetical protein FACS1894189_0230 [Planctomycetales bacterium]|nr:hypothetical protein FACS1894189_0230 [Planctomycetales bacterium]
MTSLLILELTAFILTTSAILIQCRMTQPIERIRLTQGIFLIVFLSFGTTLIPSMPKFSLPVLPVEKVISTSPSLPPVLVYVEPKTAEPKTVPVRQAALQDELTAPQAVSANMELQVESHVAPQAMSSVHGIIAVLLFVAAFFLVQELFAVFRLRWIISKSEPVNDAASGITLPRNVRLRKSDLTDSPILCNVFRPLILVPSKMTGEALQLAIAHEAAHIKRYDLATWRIMNLLAVIFWMQPFYWLLRKQLRIDQDYLADAEAAGIAPVPEDYAAMLLSLSQNRVRYHSLRPAVLHMADTRPLITRRIAMLLRPTQTLRFRCRRSMTFGITLFAVMTTLLMGTIRLTAQTEKPDAADAVTDAAPFGESKNIGVPFTFNGFITDRETKKPIKDADVCVQFWVGASFDNGTGQSPTTNCLSEQLLKTDDTGKYSVDLPDKLIGKSNLYICISAGHYDYANGGIYEEPIGTAMSIQKMPLKTFHDGSLELDRITHVKGTVLSPDGKPLPKTFVRTFSYQNEDLGDTFEAVTDSNGQFDVKVHPKYGMVLWVIPKDYAPTVREFAKVKTDAGQIKVEPGFVVTGKLLDRNGKPAAGAWVNVTEKESPARFPQDKIWRASLTDQNGNFKMNPLASGNYQIHVFDYCMDSLVHLDRRGWEVSEMNGARTVAHIKRWMEKNDAIPQKPVTDIYVAKDFILDKSTLILDIKPLPSETLQFTVTDSAGKPYRNPLFIGVTGKYNGKVWQGGRESIQPNDEGKLTLEVVKGLEHTVVSCGQTDIDRSRPIRFQVGKNSTPKTDWCIELGKVDKPIDDIAVTVLKQTFCMITVVDEAKKPFELRKDSYPFVQVTYKNDKFKDNDSGKFGFIFGYGRSSLSQTKADGERVLTWRPQPVLPGEEFTIEVKAKGFKPAVITRTLPENSVEEYEMVMKEADK